MKPIKRALADWMFKHTTFPNGRYAEKNRLWFMKGSCVVCVAGRIESLSNIDYMTKYKPIYTLTLGNEKFQMCEHHGRELAKVLCDEFLLEDINGQNNIEQT